MQSHLITVAKIARVVALRAAVENDSIVACAATAGLVVPLLTENAAAIESEAVRVRANVRRKRARLGRALSALDERLRREVSVVEWRAIIYQIPPHYWPQPE